ncbi:MAG TPA: hypothetical protein ENF41_03300 [Candidatus Bathyarchaeota archaeon]|mgnify:CR=1 FL=1|nr:hypothetical protein [Candidatus Bathyarchaeota archaeon]
MRVEYKSEGHIWAEPPYVELYLYDDDDLILKYKLIFCRDWITPEEKDYVIVAEEDEGRYDIQLIEEKISDVINSEIDAIKSVAVDLEKPRLVIEFNDEAEYIIDYIKTKL